MATGIVRRIDELGRIVIPKEMRRTMRLQVGDEMEISSSGDALVLRKYGGFESVIALVKSVAKSLSRATRADVIFASADCVAVAEGKNKRHYDGARFSDAFVERLRERSESIFHGDDLKGMFQDRECLCAYVVVMPIIVGGDFVGNAMLMLDCLPSDVARAYLNFCVELIEASLS